MLVRMPMSLNTGRGIFTPVSHPTLEWPGEPPPSDSRPNAFSRRASSGAWSKGGPCRLNLANPYAPVRQERRSAVINDRHVPGRALAGDERGRLVNRDQE